MQFQAAVDENPADLDLSRHLRQLESRVLEIGNRLAERLALAGVFQRPLQSGFSRRQPADGNSEALLRQFLHQISEAHPRLPQQIFLGHANVLEEQLRSVLRFHADFFQTLALGKARGVGLDQEQAGALRARFRIGLGHDNHQVCQIAVGDERLRTVDDIVVAIEHCGGFHPLQIRTGAWFGHGNRGNHLAGYQFWQVFVFQRFTAVMQDVRCDDVRMQGKTDAGQAQAPHFFDHHRAVEKVRAQPTVFFRQVRTEHPRLPRLVPELAVDIALFFPLAMKRHSFFFEKRSHAVAEKFVLGTEQGSGNHAAPVIIFRRS